MARFGADGCFRFGFEKPPASGSRRTGSPRAGPGRTQRGKPAQKDEPRGSGADRRAPLVRGSVPDRSGGVPPAARALLRGAGREGDPLPHDRGAEHLFRLLDLNPVRDRGGDPDHARLRRGGPGSGRGPLAPGGVRPEGAGRVPCGHGGGSRPDFRAGEGGPGAVRKQRGGSGDVGTLNEMPGWWDW